MFDLDQSLADWRRQLRAAGVGTPARLQELEAHLREELEQQLKSGISAQRAFEVAIQQIGPATLLKGEFDKLDRTKAAREWRRLQLLIVACLGVVSVPTVILVLTNSELTPVQELSGLSAVVVMILLAALGQLGHGCFPAIFNQRVRNATGISGSALGVLGLAFLAYVILPRMDFIRSQLMVATVWTLTLTTGGLWGFIGGLEKAALRHLGGGSTTYCGLKLRQV